MTYYLAHNFAARDYIKNEIIPKLSAAGHTTSSRWLYNDLHVDVGPHQQKTSATEDLEDVEVAHGLILFTDNMGERPGRGKYVELGYALALGKQVVLCGSPESRRTCVFYYLPQVQSVDNIEEFLNGKAKYYNL